MPLKELNQKFSEIAVEIQKRDDFAVVHHYDADGCSGGAIVATALKRAGKTFQTKWVKQLYAETISEIKGLGKNYIFVDFGSGQLGLLKEAFGEDFFVFDHHQPADVKHNFHVNPFHFGIDGGNEISGAGMAYFFAKALDEKNKDLSHIAVVGALGDMQDFGGKLSGANAEIVKDAEEAGVLKRETDLRLYGRISRPLLQFIEFSSSPILPNLTANEQNCFSFLKELSIPLKQQERWRSYNDLTKDEKKRLTSALIVHLHKHNTPEWKIKELIGDVYTLVNEKPTSPLRDAKEYATLLNSCGRHAKAEIALAVAMGNRLSKYEEAISLLAEHKKQLREGIELMIGEGVEERETFYFFDADTRIKDSIVGIIAGMLYGSGNIDSSKPIIALARHEDGTVKVSARATGDLVRKGLNLGKTFKEICSELNEGAEGGGHKIACGAKINPDQKEKFLQLLNQKLKETYT